MKVPRTLKILPPTAETQNMAQGIKMRTVPGRMMTVFRTRICAVASMESEGLAMCTSSTMPC